MKKQITPLIGPPVNEDGYTVSELLAALSAQQYRSLIGFARSWLHSATNSRALQRAPAAVDAEDLADQALLKLAVGEAGPGLGRHLKPRSRASLEAFLAGVKGVIQSDLNHLLDQARNRCEHLAVGEPESDPGFVDPPGTEDPGRSFSRRDLHRVLFGKLYGRVARRPDLLAVVQDWEARFLDDDRIGSRGHDPDVVHRVRHLAREILVGLAEESALAPTGREMLL